MMSPQLRLLAVLVATTIVVAGAAVWPLEGRSSMVVPGHPQTLKVAYYPA